MGQHIRTWWYWLSQRLGHGGKSINVIVVYCSLFSKKNSYSIIVIISSKTTLQIEMYISSFVRLVWGTVNSFPVT